MTCCCELSAHSGDHLCNPLFEAVTSILFNEHLAAATFHEEGRVGYSRVLARDRRPYRTRDGWMAVMPYTAAQWRQFLMEVQREVVIAQAWFADSESRHTHIDDLYSAIAEVLPQRETAAWLAVLSRLDIPCAKVNLSCWPAASLTNCPDDLADSFKTSTLAALK